MKTLFDLQYNEFCALDAYLPPVNGFQTIVHFHGGGMETGDKKACQELGESFVKAGYAFVSVNYRMYPTAKFPQYLEDCAKAIAFVKAHCKEWGGNGELLVSGQSAGAWLSSMLCVNGVYLKNEGIDPLEIKAWLIDSAQMTSHYNVQKYELGREPWLQRIDEYAPVYYVDGNLRFSKMLLIFYENDMVCRVEQNRLFHKAVLHFNPQAEIEAKLLVGGHCQGSSKKDEDGEFPFVKECLAFLRKGETENERV